MQFRIAGDVVQATLAAGEAMELRVTGGTWKLAPSATLEVPCRHGSRARFAPPAWSKSRSSARWQAARRG